MDSWRGVKEGVLFIPGSEAHGFLVHPDASVFAAMSGPKADLIKAVDQGTGMLFLSHVESKVNHSMDGVMGMEIYNRHYDATSAMSESPQRSHIYRQMNQLLMDDCATISGISRKVGKP